MGQIKILIVDDHTIFCEGLKRVLEAQAEFKVVGVAKNGLEALQKTGEILPDVVLMDLEMPGLGGMAGTRALKQRFPHVNVLMLTMHTRDKFVLESRQAGACGYILKDAPVEELRAAIITAAANDGKIKDSELNRPVFSKGKLANIPALTEREQEIVALVAAGLTNKDIADQLSVSMHTIKNHLYNIFAKLNCANRAEVVSACLKK